MPPSISRVIRPSIRYIFAIWLHVTAIDKHQTLLQTLPEIAKLENVEGDRTWRAEVIYIFDDDGDGIRLLPILGGAE